MCAKPFMVMCRDNLTCIHQDLFCDGNSQCKDDSDEDPLVCEKCPRNFGFPKSKLASATFLCSHRYTKKAICSVPCDGEDDLCLDNADEICQDRNVLLTIGFSLFLLGCIILVGEVNIRHILTEKSQNGCKTQEVCREFLELFKSCSQVIWQKKKDYKHILNEYKQFHNSQPFKRHMKIFVAGLERQNKCIG